MTTHTNAEIFSVKEEYSHNLNAMAAAILNKDRTINAQAAEVQRQRAELQNSERNVNHYSETIQSLERQRKEAYAVIDQQEKEIANHSERAEETKLLLSQLQSKYVTQTETLAQCESARVAELTKHLAFVEGAQSEINFLRERARKLEHRAKYIADLLSENQRLVEKANSRVLIRRVRAFFTDRVSRIIRRQDEDAVIDAMPHQQ